MDSDKYVDLLEMAANTITDWGGATPFTEELRAAAKELRGAEPVALHLDEYDAGLLPVGDFPDAWWRDYVRSELGRAYDFYIQQIQENYTSPPLKRLSEDEIQEISDNLCESTYYAPTAFDLYNAIMDSIESKA